MEDFGDVFSLNANFFQGKAGTMNEDEFLTSIVGADIDYMLYERSKYSMVALIGLTPED